MTSLVNQVTPLKDDLAAAKKTETELLAKLQRSDSVFERKEAELRDEFRRREYRLKEVKVILIIATYTTTKLNYVICKPYNDLPIG